MKYPIFLLVMIAASFSSCNKNAKPITFNSIGYIEGPDNSTTPCSGGYIMYIPGEMTGKRFNTLPGGSGIVLSTASFPIKVNLNWHYEDPACLRIVVDAVEKAN